MTERAREINALQAENERLRQRIADLEQLVLTLTAASVNLPEPPPPEPPADEARQETNTADTTECSLEREVYERTAMLQHATRQVLIELGKREQVEQALRESQSLLQGFLDHSPASIFVKDINGTFLMVNQYLSQVIHLEPQDMVGKHETEFLPTEVISRWHKSDQQILATRKPVETLEPIYADDGIHTFLTVKFPIFNEQGAIYALGGISTDVTEQKRSEQALQVQRDLALALSATSNIQESLEQLLNNVLRLEGIDCGAVYRIDRHTHALHMARHVGLSSQFVELVSHFDAESPHAQFMKQGQIIYQHYPSMQFPAQDEYREMEGLRAWMIIPVISEGRLIAVINVATHQHHEIPPSTRAALESIAAQMGSTIVRIEIESALRESEERFRMLTEHAPDIIYRYRFAPTPAYEYVNSSVTDILGYPPEAYYANATLPLKRTHPDTRSASDVQDPSSDPYREPVVVCYTHKDGHEVWLEQREWLIVDAERNLIAIEGISRDITEQRHADEALQEARQMAEDAARTKSEFLANMSHEIRTPMNAVIGMTNLLLDTSLTVEQQDYVETIRISGDALLTLINDILDFSKIEAGKLDLENQPFNLRDCIEEALDLLAPGAAEKGLDLAYFIDDALPTDVLGDITRLRQILVNLLSNAVKFTDKGEIVITVEGWEEHTEARSESSEPPPLDSQYTTLHIAVRDTGIGIPSEQLNRLFRSFSQADTSTTRKYGGSGLGLAISKRLAEMMGGTMWVESEKGQGSTFHVTIMAEATSARPRPFLVHDQPHLRGKRALIVDDNMNNLHIITQQVKRWGMITYTATTGEEALQPVQEGIHFDVAILDMYLPDMDGLALAREIRCYRPVGTLPLIIWTSITLRSEVTRKASDDIAAFLVKPIRPAVLYDTLVNVLQGQGAASRLPKVWMEIDREMGRQHPLRILLAEDNVINQKVALRLLERLGYRADLASNGKEVLEAMYRQEYDVILMDVQMPDVDGVEATRSIRSHWDASKQPHIIALTAHALEGNREHFLQAGMDDYISKPVHMEELVAALERVQKP